MSAGRAHPRHIRQLRLDAGEERRPGVRLEWPCDICGRPIADHAGYVTLDLGAHARYEKAHAPWEAEIRAQHDGAVVITGDAFFTMPESPAWRVLHRVCDPDPTSIDYWIGVERIRTPADVMAWTAHLLGKTWFPGSHWDNVLRVRVIPQLPDDGGRP